MFSVFLPWTYYSLLSTRGFNSIQFSKKLFAKICWQMTSCNWLSVDLGKKNRNTCMSVASKMKWYRTHGKSLKAELNKNWFDPSGQFENEIEPMNRSNVVENRRPHWWGWVINLFWRLTTFIQSDYSIDQSTSRTVIAGKNQRWKKLFIEKSFVNQSVSSNDDEKMVFDTSADEWEGKVTYFMTSHGVCTANWVSYHLKIFMTLIELETRRPEKHDQSKLSWNTHFLLISRFRKNVRTNSKPVISAHYV